MKLPLDQIICHDVVKGIPLPDECVDVVITSPPYWGLRDYGIPTQSIFGGDPKCKHRWSKAKMGLVHENRNNLVGTQEEVHGKTGVSFIKKYDTKTSDICSKCGAWRGQLGLEPHPQMFIDHLVQIFREVGRVLKSTGSIYINLGDTYYGGGQGGGNKNAWKGKDKKYAHLKHKSDGAWLQSKQLLGIPWRVAIALQSDGWILRNAIIWNKLNHMPTSVKDRYACGYEFVFFFVKNQQYYFDLDAVREPHKAVSLARARYEFKVMPRAWELGMTPISGGKDVNIAPHHSGKNPGDVVVLESWGTDSNLEYHGDGKHNPMGQSPSELKKNIIESYKKNPKGKNPGDVLAVGRHHGGNLSNRATYYGNQIPKFCDPNGKNPGDVMQFDEEYWWRFILGTANSNRFYKRAYELMREWMIKNNCFDYTVFYEWYKRDFSGKWGSGTLEKGKANYLSDAKRLPFPKPETRSLGSMPQDFWSLTTQPFIGYSEDFEHFAVFPEELVVRPLLASCPRQICKKCGKPRERITKGTSSEAFNIRVRDVKEKRIKHTDRVASQEEVDKYQEGVSHVGTGKVTVGWSSCSCNASFDSGIVLDPFCGRGTVGKVAKRLGLHYVMIDIKPEYCELARLYITGQKHRLHKDQKKLKPL